MQDIFTQTFFKIFSFFQTTPVPTPYCRKCAGAETLRHTGLPDHSLTEPPQYSQQPLSSGVVVAPHQGQVTAFFGAAAAAA